MGLLKQNDSQYYNGNEVTFQDTNVVSLYCKLNVPLNDDIPNVKPANYKIFVDPTGSGQIDNYIEYPKYIENGLGSNINFLSNTTPLTSVNFQDSNSGWLIAPTSANGSGALLSVIVSNQTITNIGIVNAGNNYTDGEILTLPAGSIGVGSPQVDITITSANIITTDSYSVSTNGNGLISFFGTGIPGPIPGLYNKIAVKIQLNQNAIWENYGSYEYISLVDIVNNFIVGYTGEGKIFQKAKRSQVIFHAKRGLQEFSYDTLRSVKSQELDLKPNATAIIPPDYVNYVSLSWVDASGVKHPIYPTTLTSSPTQPIIQDADGMPTQNSWGENMEAGDSNTNINWRKLNSNNIDGLITSEELNANVYNWTWWDQVWGQRYGLEPEVSNFNGWFNIDRRTNTFRFSSQLKGRLIILEYISDGLASDEDTKVPKMAEQALYMHIAHAIASTTPNMQEYIIRRYQKDRRAALRNAKIRLSNIKLNEFVQVMRGKSKWIKH